MRVPDQWVDEPQGRRADELIRLIDHYQMGLRKAISGEWVNNAVLRAFAQTAQQFNIPWRWRTGIAEKIKIWVAWRCRREV